MSRFFYSLETFPYNDFCNFPAFFFQFSVRPEKDHAIQRRIRGGQCRCPSIGKDQAVSRFFTRIESIPNSRKNRGWKIAKEAQEDN